MIVLTSIKKISVILVFYVWFVVYRFRYALLNDWLLYLGFFSIMYAWSCVIWYFLLFYRSLSDIDADGRLSCEEFVLAMHLVESVKAGDALPTVLPADLIPPSHRRKRSTSIQSGKYTLYYFRSLEKYSR